jgi:hypothetical protein
LFKGVFATGPLWTVRVGKCRGFCCWFAMEAWPAKVKEVTFESEESKVGKVGAWFVAEMRYLKCLQVSIREDARLVTWCATLGLFADIPMKQGVYLLYTVGTRLKCSEHSQSSQTSVPFCRTAIATPYQLRPNNFHVSRNVSWRSHDECCGVVLSKL